MRNILLIYALLLCVSAIAADDYKYSCYGTDDYGNKVQVDLTVNESTLTMTTYNQYDNTSAVVNKGERDYTYKPRLNIDYARYFLEDYSGEGYSVSLLVRKDMLEGSSKGRIKEVDRGEGYFNTSYYCTLKQ